MSKALKRLKITGFTIVELLIVIVVIGILVAVSVVTYNGVQKSAIDKAVLSDVDGVSGEVARYGTKNQGVYDSTVAWYSPSGVNPNISFTPSSGTVIYVATNNTNYCIRGYNTASKTYISLANPAIKESVPGVCADMGIGVVTTLAGSISQGSNDGTGSAAGFSNPRGVAVDSFGKVYVADYGNNMIRKISPTGDVTTLAGSITAGPANGNGAAAQFNGPKGVAVDSSGTVYVADTYNHLIRKISPTGDVTTLAGSGTAGPANGNGAAAQFNTPYGVAVDSSGTVYVADNFNNMIRKISPTGDVTTLAGSVTAGSADGNGAAAQFNNPKGIAVDSSGTVYVTDTYNYLIRKISPTGDVTTLAGNGAPGSTNGIGNAAQFSTSFGVVVNSSGTVYIADYGNHLIRKITSAGVTTTLAGSTYGFIDGMGSAAQFRYPFGIAVDSSGTVYVGDSYNNSIRKIK